jgi:putative tryptophan/tyrosine transport system substrate-binding protein
MRRRAFFIPPLKGESYPRIKSGAGSPSSGEALRNLRRREFITLTGAAAAPILLPRATAAQERGKILQIGFLYPGPEGAAASRMAAVLSGLETVGLRQHDQVAMIPRAAGGDLAKLAPMAGDLVARKVDLISAISPVAIRAAMAATSTIPIVAGDLESEPVAAGFVASIVHPGGNVTGVFLDFPDFGKKWLEALKEALPQVTNVFVFWDPATGEQQLNAVSSAAKALGITLDKLEVRGRADAEAAFAAARARRAGALVMLSSPFVGGNTNLVADLAQSQRLPAITLFTDFAREGGLMAYGPNLTAYFQQQGVMAGKILKGANPAELPVEAPTKFEFVVNLKAARALGLTMPASILIRADEVIE